MSTSLFRGPPRARRHIPSRIQSRESAQSDFDQNFGRAFQIFPVGRKKPIQRDLGRTEFVQSRVLWASTAGNADGSTRGITPGQFHLCLHSSYLGHTLYLFRRTLRKLVDYCLGHCIEKISGCMCAVCTVLLNTHRIAVDMTGAHRGAHEAKVLLEEQRFRRLLLQGRSPSRHASTSLSWSRERVEHRSSFQSVRRLSKEGLQQRNISNFRACLLKEASLIPLRKNHDGVNPPDCCLRKNSSRLVTDPRASAKKPARFGEQAQRSVLLCEASTFASRVGASSSTR